MCVCLYVRTLREGRLSSSFLTSHAHSPNLGCHLFKFQVPTAWARDSADFSASMRTDACPPSKGIVMASVRCTLYVVPAFPSDLCPSKQLLPIRHAHRKQVGHSSSSQSHFRANLIAHCPCSAFEGTTFFVNNVHLIDVTIHCFAPYFLFVKQITPVNFPNWQWRMFGLPLNTLLLTLKIKMTMQKKRENRDSWIQKGWRGSAYGKILFLSIWKDWFH